MILGLDLSTSIIGMCIVDKNGDTFLQEHIDLRKEETLFDKVKLAKETFLGTIHKNNIKHLIGSAWGLTDLGIDKTDIAEKYFAMSCE